MTPDQIDVALAELETRLDRLRALYEQYFMGIERLEPQVPKKDVERRFHELRKTPFRNTARRFKFQTLSQRYSTMTQYWTRICREIENGTYKRHKLKAERGQAGSREQFEDIDSNESLPSAESAKDQASRELAALLDDNVDASAELERAVAEASAHVAAMAEPASPAAAKGLLGRLRAESKPETASANARLAAGPALPPLPSRPGAPPPRISEPSPGGAPPPRRASSAPGRPSTPPPAPSSRPAPLPRAPSAGLPPLPPPRPNAAAGLPPPPRPSSAAGLPPPRPSLSSIEIDRASIVDIPRPSQTDMTRLSQTDMTRPSQTDMTRPSTAVRASQAREAAQAAQQHGLSEERLRQLHKSYLEARAQTQATAVSYEKLAQNVRDTERKLREQHGGKNVDFEVLVRDGKAILKPRVR